MRDGFAVIELPHIGREIYMPLELSKCDSRQYEGMCELLYRLTHSEISPEDFLTLGVYVLLDLKIGKRKISGDEIEEAFSNITAISELLGSYFVRNEEQTVVKLAYEGNHFEKIDLLPFALYGPEQYFKDVTFHEYEDALNVFMNYQEKKDPELLRRITAIFYRPKRFGKRVAYDPNKVDAGIKKLKNVPMGIIYGVYYTFAAFHEYFTSSRVRHEGKIIDMTIIFSDHPDDEKNTESEFPSLGMKSIGYQLAESGVFGSLKEVRQTLVWESVLRLYDIRKRDLDAKKKLKAEKPEQ